MSIITERLLSQINEETLNEAKGSRKDSKEKPASDAKATPSSAKPKTALEKIKARNQSIIVDKLTKNAYINKNERFSNIKAALKDYVDEIKKANSAGDISDDDAIKEFKRINAVFLYQTGWDLFPMTGNFRNLSLSPDKIGEVSKLLPKGKNWDSQASKTVYDNRTDKQKTLIHYWILIEPEGDVELDEPYIVIGSGGAAVAMSVKTKKGIVTKAGKLKGDGLQNLPTDKNSLKLIDLINIAKAWDNFDKDDEDALRADIKGTKIASRGAKGRRRRVRRAGPTAASTYNIRKAPRDRWIGGYQNKLKSFYDKNAATKAIASNYETRKLTDTRYGYRTHFVTIKAAENIISQLDKFLKPKAAAKPAATPAPAAAAKAAPAKPATANERRIKQLSKLLETKLVGSELNLFNEQDTPASEAEKKKKLQALLKELNEIKTRLTDAYNENRRPKTNEAKEIQGKDLDRFNKILSMLSWNEKGEIDFNEVYKKMQPAVAAKEEPTKPAKEAVKRPSETSCFYAIDRTISGVTDMSPTKIWAEVGESWDRWYKEALELLEDEAASRQFYYLSGPQSSYLGVVKSMDKNAALNINLFCVSRYMEKFLLNLEGNGIAAQNLAKAGPSAMVAEQAEPVENYSNFVGPDGTFVTSRANKLANVLRKVLAAIPKLRRNQNQNAKATGDKRLLTTPKQAAAQNKAAATAAKPSKAVAAAVAAKGTPAQARKVPTSIDEIVKIFLERAKERDEFKQTILKLGTPGTTNTQEVMELAKVLFKTNSPNTRQLAMVNAAITNARNGLTGATSAPAPTAKPTAKPAPATQKESIKEKREKLLHEAIFKKLVK